LFRATISKNGEFFYARKNPIENWKGKLHSAGRRKRLPKNAKPHRKRAPSQAGQSSPNGRTNLAAASRRKRHLPHLRSDSLGRRRKSHQEGRIPVSYPINFRGTMQSLTFHNIKRSRIHQQAEIEREKFEYVISICFRFTMEEPS